MEKEKIIRLEKITTYVDYGKENYYNINLSVRTYESEKTLTDVLKEYRTEKENITILENENEINLKDIKDSFDLIDLVSMPVKSIEVERYHDLRDRETATLKVKRLVIAL